MHEGAGKRGRGDARGVQPEAMLGRVESLVQKEFGVFQQDAPPMRGPGRDLSSRMLGEPVLENHLSRHRIVFFSPAALLRETIAGLPGGEPLVHEVDRHPEACFQLVAESPREAGGVLFGTVHVERQTDHHRLRLPALDEARERRPVRLRLACGQRGQRSRGAGERLAHRNPDVPASGIESEESPGRGVARRQRAGHA